MPWTRRLNIYSGHRPRSEYLLNDKYAGAGSALGEWELPGYDWMSYYPKLPPLVVRVMPDPKIQSALDLEIPGFITQVLAGRERLVNLGVQPDVGIRLGGIERWERTETEQTYRVVFTDGRRKPAGSSKRRAVSTLDRGDQIIFTRGTPSSIAQCQSRTVERIEGDGGRMRISLDAKGSLRCGVTPIYYRGGSRSEPTCATSTCLCSLVIANTGWPMGIFRWVNPPRAKLGVRDDSAMANRISAKRD